MRRAAVVLRAVVRRTPAALVALLGLALLAAPARGQGDLSTVVGNPSHPVRVEGRRPEGPDADWVHLPDPIADALKQMAARVAELEREVAELRGTEPAAQAEIVRLRPAHGPSPAGG